MKYIFYALLCLFMFSACSSAKKNYLERSDTDKALFDAVKALKKNSNDTAAGNALPTLYSLSQQRHLRRIESLQGMQELSRWDKIIDEYESMQGMHNAIIDVDAAYRAVTPANYQPNIYTLKQQAAQDYYNEAESYLSLNGRDNAKKAYTHFKKADRFVPGFKDSKEKMDLAYQNAIVNVQVNPVQDNSYFFNSSWGNYGYNYSNEYFQQTLVRELRNSNRYPARFYTDWEARRDNVQPDWVVDLTLRGMNIPSPQRYRYSRNTSRQIESGRDSSGKPIYQTVYATVHISRESLTARGEMEVLVNDVTTGKIITRNNFREEYSWMEEYATYSGDSRALSASDWNLVNNRYNEPRKEDILNELYRKIYPQVKNRIIYAVDW
ncbi:MAG TPA: hypothetical protein DCQ97_03255 [Chitinophagaceae bacterium]|nr:hypothetical protein [Chitinophagaceae bacterium]